MTAHRDFPVSLDITMHPSPLRLRMHALMLPTAREQPRMR